jgi:hypothetical protein
MVKFLVLLLLIGCSEKVPRAIDMTEFSNKCVAIGNEMKMKYVNATAWHDEKTGNYVPICSMQIDETSKSEFHLFQFDEKELNAINFYKQRRGL